jgi:alkanesulfonate monooxygenase SsuD/methylene tetrahydromethanopterin reductase-like flavin-dependent oxidoreductase (luciferase family)
VPAGAHGDTGSVSSQAVPADLVALAIFQDEALPAVAGHQVRLDQVAVRLDRVDGVTGVVSERVAHDPHFEDASEWADEDAVAESVLCSPDPEQHVKRIEEFVDAGYDNVYFHQVGPDQEGFLDFAETELLPRLR